MSADVTKELLEALKGLLVRVADDEEYGPDHAVTVARVAIARAEAALAEPQPDADGWINPNDKTQKQYLPHIGENVLFCHAGVTYYGKHTGGSFQSFNPPRRFCTWDCLWMYPPKAREDQP